MGSWRSVCNQCSRQHWPSVPTGLVSWRHQWFGDLASAALHLGGVLTYSFFLSPPVLARLLRSHNCANYACILWIQVRDALPGRPRLVMGIDANTHAKPRSGWQDVATFRDFISFHGLRTCVTNGRLWLPEAVVST
jgi:hypothetical protein